MKQFTGPILLLLIAYSNPVAAASEAFNALCEQGARQVASAWGTPAMDAHIARDFSGNLDQFKISDTDAAYGLRLDVVSVDKIRKVAEGRCTAQVAIRFVHPQPDHSLVEILPPVTGSWTLNLPKPATDSAQPSRFNAATEGSLEGVAMLRVHWELPPGSREVFLQDADVKAERLTASAQDEDAVLFPLQPASGWVVRVGEQETMTEKDGSFVLQAAQSGVREAQIVNPATGVVFHTFSLEDLVRVGTAQPEPIIVELQSHGGCGMDDDDPQHCGQ